MNVRVLQTLPNDLKQGAALEHASHVVNMIAGSKSLFNSVKNETVSNVKREITSQTDQDTSKVVRTSTTVGTTGMSAVSSITTPLKYSYYERKAASMAQKLNRLNESFFQTESINQLGMQFSSVSNVYDEKGHLAGDALTSKHTASVKDGLSGNVASYWHVHDGNNQIVNNHAAISNYATEVKNVRQYMFDKAVRDYGLGYALTHKHYVGEHYGVSAGESFTFQRFNKAFDKMSKYENAMDSFSKPKSFGMGAFRLATMPLKGSEAMKGVDLGSATYRGLKNVNKFVFRPITNVTFNVGLKAVSASRVLSLSRMNKVSYASMRNILLRSSNPFDKAFKFCQSKTVKFSNIFGKNPLLVSLRNLPMRGIRLANAKFTTFILDKTGLLYRDSTLGTFARNKARMANLKYNRIKTGMTKKTYKIEKKNIRKSNHRAIKKIYDKTKLGKFTNRINNRINVFGDKLKDIKKGIKSGVKNGFKATGRFLSKPARWVLNETKFGRGIRDFFKKIAGKIAEWFKNVMAMIKSLGAFISSVVSTIAVTLGVLIIAYYVVYGVARFYDMFVFDHSAYAQKAKYIYNQIVKCHQEQLQNVLNIAMKYDAASIDYPNGTRDNVKEVWSGVSVMLQEQIDKNAFKKKEVQDITRTLYHNTHTLTFEYYDFEYDDGTIGHACNIFLDINHGETFAYEIMSNEKVETLPYVPTLVADSADWLSVVKNTKLAMAQASNEYNSSKSVKVNFVDQFRNLQQHEIRLDSTGYLSECLRIYGSISGNISTYDLLTKGYMSRFLRFKFTGFSDLQEGDILVSKDGVSVYGWTIGNNDYVYSWNEQSTNIAATNKDNGLNYELVWRPIYAGVSNKNTVDVDSVNETDRILYPNVPMFSNEPEFDENGNESMALVSVKNTLQDFLADPWIFTSRNFNEFNQNEANAFWTGEVTDHILTDAINGKTRNINAYSGRLSSTDFLRCVLAQHGIKTDYDPIRRITELGDVAPLTSLQTGDVIWYISPLEHYITSNYENIYQMMPSTPIKVDGEESFTLNGTGIEFKYTVGGLTQNEEGIKLESQDGLCHYAIPLIVLDTDSAGNAWVVGYTYDLLKPIDWSQMIDSNIVNNEDRNQHDWAVRDDWTDDNIPQIYKYNLKDLDESRVWFSLRPRGYTREPIFGATMYFEGWTDENIVNLMDMINDSCWSDSTNVYHLSHRGDVEGEDKTVSWKWYKDIGFDLQNDSSVHGWGAVLNCRTISELKARAARNSPETFWDFVFPEFSSRTLSSYFDYRGYATQEHIKELENNLVPYAVTSYEETGILPSTAYCYALALSNSHTSMESLFGKNIYSLLADSSWRGNFVTIDDYEYPSQDTVNKIRKDFRMYDYYEDCYDDWVKAIVHMTILTDQKVRLARESVNESNIHNIDNTNFVQQMNILNRTQAPNDTWSSIQKVSNAALSVYSSKRSYMENIDKIAKERRTATENIEWLDKEINILIERCNNANVPTDEDCEKLMDYIKLYAVSGGMLAGYPDYVTERSDNAAYMVYNNVDDYLSELKDIYKKWQKNKKAELISSIFASLGVTEDEWSNMSPGEKKKFANGLTDEQKETLKSLIGDSLMVGVDSALHPTIPIEITDTVNEFHILWTTSGYF